jgi:predicted lipoprotein with Yx(FWY)xxD motif
MGKQRRVALVGVAVAIALFATGCGSSGGDASGNDVKPAGQAAADGSAGAAARAKAGPAKALELKNDAKLGEIVTDAKGWTLYRSDDDTASPSKSNCSGDCEKLWPPVPAKDAKATKGVAKSDIGKVKRSDKSWQLTLGGWPVYRYAKDDSPGDTKGQGVKGTWNALTANGGKASAKELRAVDDPELGKIVADGKGRTLYRYDGDSAWPMKSNCTGTCLGSWKPAKPVDKSKISGIDPRLLSTYKRPDGTEQLTIDCWPLYWYTGDKKPGDVNGQGKQGKWHAATPDGKKAGAAAGE